MEKLEVIPLYNPRERVQHDHQCRGGAGAPPARSRRRPGRQRGDATPTAQTRRQEYIREALDYRRQGLMYQQIAEQMQVSLATAYRWVQQGLAAISTEAAKELGTLLLQRLVPLLDDADPREVVDRILKAQARVMRPLSTRARRETP